MPPRPEPEHATAGAIAAAARQVVPHDRCKAIVAFTAPGATALRVARERPEAPIIGLTPLIATARRMAVVWGVHAVVAADVHSMSEAVTARRAWRRPRDSRAHGEEIVVAAGVPFGHPGTTNALRVATVR